MIETAMRTSLPIPCVLNLFLCTTYSALYVGIVASLQFLGSGWLIFAVGIVFAIVMIPIYSLLHEAEHSTLHPNSRLNDLIGQWLGILFGISFTFFKHCHIRHHKKNRTDLEMWDLYTINQVKWKRTVNLYVMMSGIGYSLIFLSTAIIAVYPRLLYIGLFQKHNELAGFLEGSNEEDKIAVMRKEAWAVIVFHLSIFWIFNVPPLTWIAIFAIHAFIWSSQNYVNHAFSRRHIVEGAHNLRVPRWLTPIYLHFNLHLVHHQHPQIPWIHLPKFVPADEERISFFTNYLRLWTGPRLTFEPDPSISN